MDDERVARFVSQKVGSSFVPPYTTLGLERRGEIVAGAVFNHWTGHDVHVSVAGNRGAFTRGFIWLVRDYVFGQLNCLRMTVVTEQPAVEAIALKLGGQVEGRLRNHFGAGRDGTVIGILREEWIF